MWLALPLSIEMRDWLTSLVIVAAFVALAFVVKLLMQRVVSFFTKKTKTILDDLIVRAVKTPVFIALIVAGVWIGISRLPELVAYIPFIHKIFSCIYIIIIALLVAGIANAILTWYGTEIAVRTESDIDDKLIPLLRRVVTFIVYAFALIFILQVFGVPITSLLTVLGVGSLAVALALQPTLTNFLAGTYVMSDAVIRTGDYIMLDSGHEGTVEEIGWRTTKLRHWQGNLIIMPNSKMSDAVIIDYEKPDKSMSFSLDCGVSYESDLEKVEKITLEVAKEILVKCPEGAKDFEPVVRFKSFGDSNINFSIVLKSADRAGQFVIKHEFIKSLHSRFQKESIDIQYPVRKLLFANGLDLQNKNRNQ